jgi:hypothetical protein
MVSLPHGASIVELNTEPWPFLKPPELSKLDAEGRRHSR